jgi:hypothetical protein
MCYQGLLQQKFSVDALIPLFALRNVMIRQPRNWSEEGRTKRREAAPANGILMVKVGQMIPILLLRFLLISGWRK